MPDVRVETGRLQQRPAWCSTSATSSEGVFTVEITDGKITNFYAMRNPDKLAGVTTRQREISRAERRLSSLGGAHRPARRPRQRPRGAARRRRRRRPAGPAAARRADRRLVRRRGP